MHNVNVNYKTNVKNVHHQSNVKYVKFAKYVKIAPIVKNVNHQKNVKYVRYAIYVNLLKNAKYVNLQKNVQIMRQLKKIVKNVKNVYHRLIVNAKNAQDVKYVLLRLNVMNVHLKLNVKYVYQKQKLNMCILIHQNLLNPSLQNVYVNVIVNLLYVNAQL